MKAVFIDSAVLLYALGGPHALQEPCRALLTRASDGGLSMHMSVKGGQELLVHRLRRVGRDEALLDFEDIDALVHWHSFDAEVLRASGQIVRRGEARGRDAVHAATAIAAGFTEFVSPDPDFDGIAGLRRVDPRELAAT